MNFHTDALAKVVEAMAELTDAGNRLEKAFLLAGVDSPWMDLAHKVDAVTRDVQAAIEAQAGALPASE